MQFVVFILMLSILILIHEFGHFFMARFFKMRVEEFGVGLPPRAKTLFKRKNTIFSLNWLPLGGFVKLYGEDMENAEQAASPEAFFNKPMWQRAAVLLSGVFMNFVLGVVIFGAVYTYLGIPTKTNKVFVVEVGKGTPAELAGIKVKGQIGKILLNEQNIQFSGVDEFLNKIDSLKGKEVQLVLLNSDGSEQTVSITPRLNPPEGQGPLGVALSSVELKKYEIWQMPFRGMVVGLQEAWSWGKEIVVNFGKIIVNLVTGKGLPKDIAGPVGIYQVSKEMYKVGWIAVLQFMAILSVNLSILNVLPFPALDGGRVAFLAIEKVIGKKKKNAIEGWVNTLGMVFLLGVMVLVTIKDIVKLFGK